MTSRLPIISCSTGAEGSLVLQGVSPNRLVDVCRVAKTKIGNHFMRQVAISESDVPHSCLATHSKRMSVVSRQIATRYLIGSHTMDRRLLLTWLCSACGDSRIHSPRSVMSLLNSVSSPISSCKLRGDVPRHM